METFLKPNNTHAPHNWALTGSPAPSWGDMEWQCCSKFLKAPRKSVGSALNWHQAGLAHPVGSLFVLGESTQTTDWERLTKTIPGYILPRVFLPMAHSATEKLRPRKAKRWQRIRTRVLALDSHPMSLGHVTVSSTCSFAGWLLLRKLLMETLLNDLNHLGILGSVQPPRAPKQSFWTHREVNPNNVRTDASDLLGSVFDPPNPSVMLSVHHNS